MAEHGFVSNPPIPTSGPARGRAPGTRPADEIVLRAWYDPAVDRSGHDPRSDYVERFWLGVLGPSATWLARRLATEVSAAGPSGTRVDLTVIARSMGMSYSPGRASPFARAIQRCVMFGVAHHTGDGLAVRRRLPNVAERHLRRLPPAVVHQHDRWLERDHLAASGRDDRVRRLALVMHQVGDDPQQIEHQLVAVGADPASATRIVTDLRERLGSPTARADDALAVRPAG